MKRCIVFCAADFDKLLLPVSDQEYLIAADGGLSHCERLGLQPDCVLGDFDSLGYVPQGANVFPVEKDDTDMMLALRKGLEQGCKEFLIYGGMDGPRLDHTMANFQSLMFLSQRGARGYLVGKEYIATVITDGALSLPACDAGIVSVFCMGAAAQGVTIAGLQYPLKEGTLEPGFPLGVSNHFVGWDAKISVKKGSLLVLWPTEVGFGCEVTP